MIHGIGHDIVSTTRIKRLLQAYDYKFVSKLLSSAELLIYPDKTNKINYLAKRFAAKEAIAKAFGTGLRYPLTMPNLTVLNDKLGRPYFELSPLVDKVMAKHKINNIFLSLSDDRDLVSAMVILER